MVAKHNSKLRINTIRKTDGKLAIIYQGEHTMESKIFDVSTEKGLTQAEQYKTRLENKYNQVLTQSLGLTRVRIEGRTIRQS